MFTPEELNNIERNLTDPRRLMTLEEALALFRSPDEEELPPEGHPSTS
jgi:hypothetical protein